jgi:hypothetical protein
MAFTNSPYNKVLALNAVTVGCPTGPSTFATLATLANASGETPFSATSIASPVAGVCTITVADNLSDQPNPLPTFRVTYTTSQVTGSSTKRH